MNYFGAYTQGSAIEESFGPHDFGSSPPGAGNSQNSNNFNFNFEFPFRDQPYHLPPLEASTLSQFTQPDVAGSSFNYPGPSGVQFTTPPPFLWSAFPRLPPIPAPASSSRLLNPIAAHLDHRPASGSAKRKSRDDDPTIDSEIHTRRPRKMPKRADLWGV
ncbi:hypothetical protein B0H17DRAFT_1154107 [Mycena rosella]|uniref:Uncharacterized protein n=1 Tax=Mycena rosella TaxID=1033263 RepID=A0AAD7AZV6_MYCRO|nr:hypothetical protein B0H17DRAFT_1154107 [Mycena rosella]